MKIHHALCMLMLSTFALGAEVTQGSACGLGTFGPPVATAVTPPMSIVPLMCGMQNVWLCDIDPGAAAVSRPWPSAPCGVELCGADEAAAVAAATALLHGAPGVPRCIAIGFITPDRAKAQAAIVSWDGTCLKAQPAPCKEVGALCEIGAGECCAPLLCDPAFRDVDEPYVCCADPSTHGPCKVTTDCCLGRCEGNVCICSDVGGACSSLWDCCEGYCAGGACACIATGDPCDDTAPRSPCCEGDNCIGDICTPG